MRKLLPLVALGLLFASCKKEYTCNCYSKESWLIHTQSWKSTSSRAHILDEVCTGMTDGFREGKSDSSIVCKLDGI